jgi:formamidopyrimidine-DNA glycosylase
MRRIEQVPELAEVETTRRGITPHVLDQSMVQIIIRQGQLRWPVPRVLVKILPGQQFVTLKRRGKYLLFDTGIGTMIVHLGMSGCLRIVNANESAQKHDHVDFIFESGHCLRYTDPRRFGSIHWTTEDPLQHKLLHALGPEPLSAAFSANYLLQQSRRRNVPIKSFIMNSQVVVGVGNIYATESLFRAKIHPLLPAAVLTIEQCDLLVRTIKIVLKEAIKQGGTTLRDFLKADGKPGYFRSQLQAYGRASEACFLCTTKLKMLRINQRSTVFCPSCQVF